MGRASEFRTKWRGLALVLAAIGLLAAGFLYKHRIADATEAAYHENWLVQSVIAPRAHQLYPAPAGQAAKAPGKGAEPDVCVT
jgi:hypothetical protein